MAGGFLGCGTLYFNRITGGTSSGWLKVGNATKMAIKTNSTLKERKSRQCNSYGQVVDSVSIPEPSDLSIDLDTLDRTNLAYAFLGKDFDLNVSSGTVTDEAITVADLDTSFQVANGNISSVVITDNTAATTYVLGTDYEIENASVGLIKVLSTGSITSGQAILVDYAYGAVTGSRITGGTDSQIKTAIKLVGKNLVDDSGVVVDVWIATVTPTSEIDFLADDFSTISLTGRIELSATKGNGFEVVIDRKTP